MAYNKFKYHVFLADHSGTSLQTALDAIPGKPFGSQKTIDQSGTYQVIGRKSNDLSDSYPGLDDYIPSSYPSWILAITNNPLNCDHQCAKAIVSTRGDSGSAWSEEIE